MSDKESEKEDESLAPSPPPSSPSSAKKLGGGNGGTFESLSASIQQNIEALVESTKEIEKANLLFQAPTLTSQEEKSLMNKVNQLVKYTNMKNRDATRLVKSLRMEAAKKPTPSSVGESKEENEESGEEESRDVGYVFMLQYEDFEVYV